MTANYRFNYGGSLGWLVVWAIFFFPVAIVLLLTNWEAEGNGKKILCCYNGSRGWLAFWTIIFFPIAFVLLLQNGFRIET